MVTELTNAFIYLFLLWLDAYTEYRTNILKQHPVLIYMYRKQTVMPREGIKTNLPMSFGRHIHAPDCLLHWIPSAFILCNTESVYFDCDERYGIYRCLNI